jgi:hypothetical protein
MARKGRAKKKDKSVHFNLEESSETTAPPSTEESPNILSHFMQSIAL